MLHEQRFKYNTYVVNLRSEIRVSGPEIASFDLFYPELSQQATQLQPMGAITLLDCFKPPAPKASSRPIVKVIFHDLSAHHVLLQLRAMPIHR
jgi:hypothetical protein